MGRVLVTRTPPRGWIVAAIEGSCRSCLLYAASSQQEGLGHIWDTCVCSRKFPMMGMSNISATVSEVIDSLACMFHGSQHLSGPG